MSHRFYIQSAVVRKGLPRFFKTMYENLDSETAKNAEVEAALIMEYGWLK